MRNVRGSKTLSFTCHSAPVVRTVRGADRGILRVVDQPGIGAVLADREGGHL